MDLNLLLNLSFRKVFLSRY